MCWRVAVHSAVLASALFVTSAARGQSRPEDLGPLPAALSLERLQQMVLLSPGCDLRNAQLLEQAQGRRAAAKGVVPILLRQAIWPVYVQLEEGPRYWGEITRTGENSFDLTNRQTKETVTVAYSEVRGIGICESLSSHSPSNDRRESTPAHGEHHRNHSAPCPCAFWSCFLCLHASFTVLDAALLTEHL